MTLRQLAFKNVVRNKRTYAAYFLSSAFSVMVFFINALLIYHPDIRRGLSSELAVQAFVLAECMVFLFSFLFVLYSVRSFLTSRKKEFGILLMHGMTLAQLGKVIFLENMIIGLSATMAGTAAGALFAKLFFLASARALEISSLPFYLSWQPLMLTLFAFVFLFLLISAYTSRIVRIAKLIDLFQAAAKNKTKPEGSLGLALLSLILLGTGYTLAAGSDTNSIYNRVIPVVIITMVGTYLFYSHFSVIILQWIKRNRKLSLRRTHLIMFSGLSTRMKEHAKLFFMVTMVSTISFCSLGVFASINVVTELFLEDYPAAVGYVSKEGNSSEDAHLSRITSELKDRNTPYKKDQIQIKYAAIHPDEDNQVFSFELPLISFSDYKQVVQLAGYEWSEESPAYNEAYVLISSQNDKSKIRLKERKEYTLLEPEVTIRETGYTKHVIIPDNLLADFDDSFEALVIHDELFAQIVSPVRVDVYTGFYVEHFEQTAFLADELADHGRTRYDAGEPYAMSVSGTLFILRESMYRILLFIAMLLAAIFFIAAGSFLYFRLYADLDYDRRQYLTLMKMGLTPREFRSCVTGQLAFLFFVPTVMAVIHSIFAFIALQSLFYLSIASKMGVVLLCFVLAQVLYFFFIRFHYLRNLKKSL
ncbi:ABC transporter permease [Paenibacillus gallinarum]|uniref:ABC transporter permease n=1 Tax=Paenibacillus gallinarum TaxID=2762232 RepID=A0ABR8T4X7_9BACL|nr:FtsX-like permease family protein [Paenibacillus gallinarum]MBD7970782.1 ABC transporter permease [Paenibacillus gallinarum]